MQLLGFAPGSAASVRLGPSLLLDVAGPRWVERETPERSREKVTALSFYMNMLIYIFKMSLFLSHPFQLLTNIILHIK